MNFQTLKIFSMLIMSVCLTTHTMYTQTATPPTSKPDETPVVVSRDTEAEPDTELPPTNDVRESVDQDEEVSTPRATELPSPPVPSSTYNISLSEAQQKMMLYLDFLAKTEARAENLRSKLFEMIEKENEVRGQIRRIEFELRPEQMRNATALSGSLRPEDVRDERRKMFQSEQRNLEALLNQIELSRSKLEAALVSADRLVERIRLRFEVYVDKALEAGLEDH